MIELALNGKMGSLASHIGDVGNQGAGQLVLNPETPLLGVGPDGLGGNRGDVDGIERTGWGRSDTLFLARLSGRIEYRPIADVADAGITDRERLGDAENNRRARFEGTGVGFVAGAVLVKDAIARADRGPAVTFRVPGKTEPGRPIEEMAAHAAGRAASNAALREPQIADNARIGLDEVSAKGAPLYKSSP